MDNTKLLEAISIIFEAGAEAGAERVIKKLQAQELLPGGEPVKYYDQKEALNLYRIDKRFKKISESWLRSEEKAGTLINYGTPRHKKYKECELIAAMDNKGKRRHDLAA